MIDYGSRVHQVPPQHHMRPAGAVMGPPATPGMPVPVPRPGTPNIMPRPNQSSAQPARPTPATPMQSTASPGSVSQYRTIQPKPTSGLAGPPHKSPLLPATPQNLALMNPEQVSFASAIPIPVGP